MVNNLQFLREHNGRERRRAGDRLYMEVRGNRATKLNLAILKLHFGCC